MVTIVILSLSSLSPSSVCVLLASSICTPTGSDPTGSAGESVCIPRTSIRRTHNYLVLSHTYILYMLWPSPAYKHSSLTVSVQSLWTLNCSAPSPHSSVLSASFQVLQRSMPSWLAFSVWQQCCFCRGSKMDYSSCSEGRLCSPLYTAVIYNKWPSFIGSYCIQ